MYESPDPKDYEPTSKASSPKAGVPSPKKDPGVSAGEPLGSPKK